MQDLLNAMRVCTIWSDIANSPLLWKTVRMNNSPIHNFTGLCNALHKHRTVHLDLRKIFLSRNTENIWVKFNKNITKVYTLKTIELDCCPAVVIEEIAKSNPNLEVLNAVAIKCASINLDPLVCLKDIKQLCLKSTSGFTPNSGLGALAELTTLRHLSLTSIKGLYKLNIEVIADLKDLESLGLGECTNFARSFGRNILAQLSNFKKLRLEKCIGNCYAHEILDVVRIMPHMEELEMINFEIKWGFDDALSACRNIKKLLIIPFYCCSTHISNYALRRGVLRLESSLSHFVWCITLELVELGEMLAQGRRFRDSEVSQLLSYFEERALIRFSSSHLLAFEIVTIPDVVQSFVERMPKTRLRILRIPFYATWNQTLTDIFN